jgi:hypothetical protein
MHPLKWKHLYWNYMLLKEIVFLVPGSLAVIVNAFLIVMDPNQKESFYKIITFQVRSEPKIHSRY